MSTDPLLLALDFSVVGALFLGAAVVALIVETVRDRRETRRWRVYRDGRTR